MKLINTNDLPRGYLSFSGYKLWLSSQQKYFDKYIIGTEERYSEALLRGKLFAEQQEIKNGIYGEIEIDCVTDKGVKLFGKLDFFDGTTIIDDKTSMNFSNIKKRSEEQILFYQLILYKKHGKVFNGELHHYQTQNDMAILLGDKEIADTATIYKCKKPTIKVLKDLEKKIEKDVINIINYITWKKNLK